MKTINIINCYDFKIIKKNTGFILNIRGKRTDEGPLYEINIHMSDYWPQHLYREFKKYFENRISELKFYAKYFIE